MTFEQASAIIASITYKPGFRLGFVDDIYSNAGVLHLEHQVPDADGKRGIIPVGMTSRIDYHYLNRDGLVRMVQGLIQNLELHEVDEWFKVDGARLKEPHPDRKS